ncbi:MAG: VTT domain-containing protein [Flavobacteriia bacterium]|jgi:membrane-associated protein
MNALYQLLDFILHIDNYLFLLIQDYGNWIYGILFLIVFVETGLVFMPLLPGDSLLFAAGTFCAGVQIDNDLAQLNLFIVLGLLMTAAILGDALNFWIGQKYGRKLAQMQIGQYRILKEKHLQRTQAFFEKHGSKTIIIARFVPIVRTFAPFTAGLANMRYSTFLKFNVIGGVSWVLGLTLLGYFFGNLEVVRNNFETVIFGIIGLSLLPMLIAIAKEKMAKR